MISNLVKRYILSFFLPSLCHFGTVFSIITDKYLLYQNTFTYVLGLPLILQF
uniref:Uncharacterized protein n=1 Tax=Anguilla anguilla TaxID=7936 RepID=A0A0E9VL53_ANGAN